MLVAVGRAVVWARVNALHTPGRRVKQRRGEGALFARMRKGDWRQNHGTSHRESTQ